MEENKILAYVRGNDVLFIVSVTTPEIDGEGKPVEDSYVPVDFTGWDDYSLRVVKQGVTRTIVAESSQLVEGENGKIVVDVPYTALCGTYSLELVGRQNGRHERSYEIMMFAIVESNDKANLIYEIIDGYKSTDLDITVQLVQSALVYGENAYQMWKHLPGNEDKTLQDYIDEVLDLNGVMQRANAAADSAEEAAETASHLPYIGTDNYVYEWDQEESEYYKTDVYVKGDPGTPADMSQLYTKAESDARYQQQIAGKGLSTNDYTNEEKSKLAGLHNYDDGPIIWLIQNLQSSLTNYYTKTETYSKTQVNNLIASVHGMEIVLVSVLPTASEETMGKIYLVPSASAAGSNTKDEYITIHEGSSYQWEVIGSTDVSLDGYVTDEELQTALASYYQKPSGGIPASDMDSSVQTALGKANTALQSESDPTVPSWAKQSSKPSYTASDVGAVPTTRTVNGKALSSDVTLSASDVGALPDDTTIPTITFIQW